MPLFLEVHTMDGAGAASDVADAHKKHVETQGKSGVNYKNY